MKMSKLRGSIMLLFVDFFACLTIVLMTVQHTRIYPTDINTTPPGALVSEEAAQIFTLKASGEIFTEGNIPISFEELESSFAYNGQSIVFIVDPDASWRSIAQIKHLLDKRVSFQTVRE